MFYSHEILTSRQHGVATVWLLATAPRTSTRRVSRQAIMEVDVPKACGTIVQPPGAPIALRLQANLLYGVGRAYQQQAVYLLGDCEKTQSHMDRFFVVGSNDLDISARKKPQQLILLDDPDFVIDFQLPAFELDFGGPGSGAKDTQKTSSQFSPAESGSRSLSSGGDSFAGGLQLRRSSTLSSPALDPMFGDASLPGIKHNQNAMFDEEELPMGGLGLAIDADGNIIEEPELPEYNQQPAFGENEDALGVQLQQPQQSVEDGPLLFDDDIFMAPAEEVPAETGVAPAQHGQKIFDIEEQIDEQEVVAPVTRKARKPKRGRVLVFDNPTVLGMTQLKAWNTDYLQNMEKAAKPRHTTPAAAKKNAWNLTFGWGLIAGDPLATGIPGMVHPLAEFSGQALYDAFHGPSVDDEAAEAPRGIRRTSSDMSKDDDDEDDERRVRARLDEEGEIGLGMDDGDLLMFDSHADIEVGREAQPHLSDQPSLPWNRQSSLIPSSAAKGGARPGVAGSNRPLESSPLVERGSALRDLERYSDNVPSSDEGDFGPLLDQHHGSQDDYGNFVVGESHRNDTQISQAMRDALDSDGRNFLVFVESIAAKKGVLKDDDTKDDHRWIQFSDLFEGEDETRTVAAQAFYQILSLVTKKALRVHQEGQSKTPFGNIHIGVRVQSFDFEERKGDKKSSSSNGADDEEQSSSAGGDDADLFASADEEPSSSAGSDQEDPFESADEYLN